MLLTDINQLRKINWGKNNLWDIHIDDLPYPFKNNFFPATDVSEPLVSVSSENFDIYLSKYKIPGGKSNYTIKVSFLDDELGTLERWFSEWMESIVDDLYVAKLSDITKNMLIMRYVYSNRLGVIEKDWVRMSVYKVFPEGEITYAGTSEAGVPAYDLNFNVVKIMKRIYNEEIMNKYGER